MRLVALLVLSACSPAVIIDRPAPQERCIPVYVDKRPAGCLSRGQLSEILSDRKSM
jgi:hypothetical protein